MHSWLDRSSVKFSNVINGGTLPNRGDLLAELPSGFPEIVSTAMSGLARTILLTGAGVVALDCGGAPCSRMNAREVFQE